MHNRAYRLPNHPLTAFRQVHLDFHTSPDIDGIGADFDADEFAATLDKARVNSVTCFARCHHGHIYYDSKVNPERIHPHLANRNLLPEQIEACHKRGIRVPIYVTVQWDQFTADAHRDWLLIDTSGKEYGTEPLKPGFYRNLDVFHPGYRQFLFAHVQEILDTMPCDGFFFDIVQSRPSVAKHWLEAMDKSGVNPEDEGERQRFSQRVMREWEADMTAFIRERNPGCTIFYNSGHVGPRHRFSRNAYSHYELESLPSGGWGYLHFPQAMRYARGLGLDCLGMTGKFHTSWGDFSSYKNEAALQFECFHMLALGAKCSIGDQLPPRGKLDAATYELIGGVYKEVEQKEPFVRGGLPVVQIGVLTPEEFVDQRPAFHAKSERDQPAVMGALRILQELRHQFDILDSDRDFGAYQLLILPDEIPVDDTLKAKLEDYVAGGGKLLMSAKSGLTVDGLGFASDVFGVRYVGEAPFSPDFLQPGDALIQLGAMSGRQVPHVMYQKGIQVEPLDGTARLADVHVPYFNRTWRHFCSHAHTPSSGQPALYPGAVESANSSCIYLMHPVFTQYHANAPRWVKTYVGAAIEKLVGKPVVEVDGPSSLLAALNYQEAEKRYVLHLLNYIPERRSQAFDTIEEVIPLYNVPGRLRLPADAGQTVILVPQNETLPSKLENGVLSVVVPVLNGHTMLAIG